MEQGRSRRLANVKTRIETGFEYVMNSMDIRTPFGKKARKDAQPFFPGQEDELRRELDKVGMMADFARTRERSVARLTETFEGMKDITSTVLRSGNNVLSVVELYEVKSLLLSMRTLGRILREAETTLPEDFCPIPLEELLDALDPRRDRMNTFYIYDVFSEKLAGLRKEKRELERDIRNIQKARREEIRKDYGILLTPKFDIVIPKNSPELLKAKSVPGLKQSAEDYMSVTFELAKSEEMFNIVRDLEGLNSKIEEEEFSVRERLSREVGRYREKILENCEKVGQLDFVLAKALYAVKHDCVKPEITDAHVVDIEEGRHLEVEEYLLRRKKKYCPVSICLSDGVTCITGANMGGKTVSLKLAGLVPMLAQYGFFVPCRRAKIGLSSYMQILIGDSQSPERGLSSFGSEMEELKEILDNSRDRSVILIDEMASGTNPVEGLALTRSLVDYLLHRPYITLMTTHFEAVIEGTEVRNMQVRGLAGCDFSKLDSELRYAGRKERVNIISKYMDYRLYEVRENREIPRDALNIARMLGISREIIDGAQKYIK